MIHMPQQRFLQTLDDLVATAQANLKQSYRPGEPDWDAILSDLMTARSHWGTPCKPEHYGKVVRHSPISKNWIVRAAVYAILLIGFDAVPAAAQSGWNSQTLGNYGTYYNGTGANQGWTGHSQTLGGYGTYSHFNGPNGEQQNCTSQTYGNQTYTNCN